MRTTQSTEEAEKQILPFAKAKAKHTIYIVSSERVVLGFVRSLGCGCVVHRLVTNGKRCKE